MLNHTQLDELRKAKDHLHGASWRLSVAMDNLEDLARRDDIQPILDAVRIQRDACIQLIELTKQEHQEAVRAA